jgi:hypothetical protein
MSREASANRGSSVSKRELLPVPRRKKTKAREKTARRRLRRGAEDPVPLVAGTAERGVREAMTAGGARKCGGRG